MRKIDYIAPALPIYGFVIQMQVFTDVDDFSKSTKNETYKNFEIYNHLSVLIKAYFDLDSHAVNNYLLSLFLSDNNSLIITGDYEGRFRIKLNLFKLKGSKLITTLNDVKNVINYLNELSIGNNIKEIPKHHGRISTLGGKG